MQLTDYQLIIKAFGDRCLISLQKGVNSITKGRLLDAKWLKHPFSITTKDVWLLKDSLQKDVVAIVALESAEVRCSSPVINKEYFMIEECEAPLYAVPYFINGRVYIICLTPSFQPKFNRQNYFS